MEQKTVFALFKRWNQSRWICVFDVSVVVHQISPFTGESCRGTSGHHSQTLPSRCLKASEDVDGLVNTRARLCGLIHPSSQLFAALFITCLSASSPLCLSSLPGFPNVKWQKRQRQTEWFTFLMAGFYILTSLPSLFLNLVQRGEQIKRQMERKIGIYYK